MQGFTFIVVFGEQLEVIDMAKGLNVLTLEVAVGKTPTAGSETTAIQESNNQCKVKVRSM